MAAIPRLTTQAAPLPAKPPIMHEPLWVVLVPARHARASHDDARALWSACWVPRVWAAAVQRSFSKNGYGASMYMYICIYTCVFMYVCMYACTYACMYACMYVSAIVVGALVSVMVRVAGVVVVSKTMRQW